MKWKKFAGKMQFVLAILLLLSGVAFLIAFELYIKDNINTTTVLVAKKNISFKEKLTTDNIELIQVKKDNVISGAMNEYDVNSVLGGYASVAIRQGTQLYSELVDFYDLVPNEKEGEFIAPLPSNWIYAVPNSLRRTYLADIYTVGSADQKLLESLIRDEQARDNGDGGEATDETDTIIRSEYKPVLTDVRISSVKDGSSRELDISQGTYEDAQANTVGKISELEIIATEEILQKLREKTDLGYKLYIVYKYERSDSDVAIGDGK